MEWAVLTFVALVAYGTVAFWKWAFGLGSEPEAADSRRRRSRAPVRALGAADLVRLRDVFRAFADRRGGDLAERPLFEPPRVLFVHSASRAVVSLQEGPDGGPNTQVAFTVPQGWDRRLEVFPGPHRTAGVETLDEHNVSVGEAAFDARWIVRADDAAFAREFLDERTRKTLEALVELQEGGPVLVSLTPSRLLVRKAGILEPAAALESFVGLAGLIHDRVFFFWQRMSGIEILEEPAPAPGTDPVCRVCGAAIPCEARVVCRRCRTPHHRDCWEFNGQCSTYACGERRCVSGESI